MTRLSLLDLSPIAQGSDARTALLNSQALARHADRLGYHRYWMAEHHNLSGVASAATAVALAFVGQGTSRIRLGAGGIMLPNHAPLMVAEQFGTLACLYPDRVDLGIGRAPGTDQVTARALRRNLAASEDQFPRDVLELAAYFEEAAPGQPVRAVPGAGLHVPLYILGSSTYGAELAAVLGLPFAFAAHFAPDDLDRAVALYRSRFRPSEVLAAPYLMVGMNAFVAETDAEAEHLFTSLIQAFINLRTGNPGPLPPPRDDLAHIYPQELFHRMRAMRSVAAVGDRTTVRAAFETMIARTGADELVLTAQIFDQQSRLESFSLAMEAAEGL